MKMKNASVISHDGLISSGTPSRAPIRTPRKLPPIPPPGVEPAYTPARAPSRRDRIGSKERTMQEEQGPVRAPEFPAGVTWLQGGPLRMADLRGKLVLIDFWDYTCVNCIRTLPYVKEWHRRYADRGLVVVG